MHSFSSLYNENTVISKEYPGPLDFDITGVDCIHIYILVVQTQLIEILFIPKSYFKFQLSSSEDNRFNRF